MNGLYLHAHATPEPIYFDHHCLPLLNCQDAEVLFLDITSVSPYAA